MTTDEEELIRRAGVSEPAKLKRVDVRLWLALMRLTDGALDKLENALNRELSRSGRLELSEAALAREAPCSRNTISDNRQRLAPLLDALRAAETARVDAKTQAQEQVREEKRTSDQKDRIIDQQASVIAAQQVEIHGLQRRIASLSRHATRADDPSPPLGRRPTARANGRQDRAASPSSR